MSALHWASDGGHYETVELLLTEGVPVSTCYLWGIYKERNTFMLYTICKLLLNNYLLYIQVDGVSDHTISRWTPLLKVGKYILLL